MELSIHVEAAILRAAFIIFGFIWGVMILRNRDSKVSSKAIGLGMVVLFFCLVVAMSR